MRAVARHRTLPLRCHLRRHPVCVPLCNTDAHIRRRRIEAVHRSVTRVRGSRNDCRRMMSNLVCEERDHGRREGSCAEPRALLAQLNLSEALIEALVAEDVDCDALLLLTSDDLTEIIREHMGDTDDIESYM